MRVGLCSHCGKPDAPVDQEGYIDRHYRADHRRDVDPSNEICASSVMTSRPGKPCQHLIPDPNCRSLESTGGQP